MIRILVDFIMWIFFATVVVPSILLAAVVAVLLCGIFLFLQILLFEGP